MAEASGYLPFEANDYKLRFKLKLHIIRLTRFQFPYLPTIIIIFMFDSDTNDLSLRNHLVVQYLGKS